MIKLLTLFACLLTTGLAAPPAYVLVKGPLSFTDHFAANLMSPNGNQGSQSSQALPRPPTMPNPPKPQKPSSSSSSEQFSKNESVSITEGMTGDNPCPKDMVQSANLNAIETIERDACCPNSIGVFAGPVGCCALEHKSCTKTARCCDSSLECNTVAGATMLTCEKPSVFTGSQTTQSSSDTTQATTAPTTQATTTPTTQATTAPTTTAASGK